MVLNLTQHVSVIPQSATITVTSGFMCLLVSILFTSPVWQLMELVLLSENFKDPVLPITHCALTIIGGHFLDVEKSEKLVLISEIRLHRLCYCYSIALRY